MGNRKTDPYIIAQIHRKERIKRARNISRFKSLVSAFMKMGLHRTRIEKTEYRPGGITKGPGESILPGEHGPEFVIPLERLRMMQASENRLSGVDLKEILKTHDH